MREYNGFNQLTYLYRDAYETRYSYRPDGLRLKKHFADSTTLSHIFDGQNIVAEYNANGSITARYLRGVNLIARDQDNLLQYFIFNAHGDVVQRTDHNGTALKNYDYDAFGVEKSPEILDVNPWRYCAEYFDREADTIYLRARNYSAHNGRMLGEDSVRSISCEMHNGQELLDPLSLNLYTYCHHNPIMFIDPSGHVKETYNLGKGWTVRIEDAHVSNGKGKHIHLEYKGGKKIFSQNDDGSPHDKNNNSPGSPPDKVLKRLKEETGWDWDANVEKFANEVDVEVFIVQGGLPTTYATLTYPDGSQVTIVAPKAMTEGGITPKRIWEAYKDSTYPNSQSHLQGGTFITPMPPVGVPSPAPAIPFGAPVLAW